MNIFTKKATAKDVHKSCNKEAKALHERAIALVAEAEQNEHQEKLKAIGFSNSSSIVSQAELARAKKIIDLKLLFPQNNIFTEKAIEKVCHKYGLLISSPGNYKGTIPLKNQKEIAGFKMPDSLRTIKIRPKSIDRRLEKLKEKSSFEWLMAMLFSAKQTKNISFPEYQSRKESYDRHYRAEENLPPFFIMATPSQFTMKNTKIVGKYKLVDKDPVVFVMHNGLYIQVSAWGDEAEKDEFKAPRLN